ncbi:MAG: protein phosphatase CheZ [Ignavibacteriales bacterium]|nr:protein phosphatase CheZ [Ignavibacteriales bacterium]
MENGSVHTLSYDAMRPPEEHKSTFGVDANDFGVIEDFIKHVRGVIPLLENVKHSIEESSSRIPKASMQLSKVTEATESATVEILNVVEAVTGQIEKCEKALDAVKRFVVSASHVPGSEETVQIITSIQKTLSETKDNSMNIAIALQVQDITSQQIAGVSHTIESIRTHLFHALKRFDDPSPEVESENGAGKESESAEGKPFDGDAHFTKAPDRQDLADEIIKQWNQTKAD